MKSKVLYIVIPIFTALVAGFAAYHFTQQKGDTTQMLQVNCLAAVIPSVVLHHQQAEIVSLLQDLAEDTKTELPKHELTRPEPFFTTSVDAELIKIAELFKAKSQKINVESTDVASAMQQAIQAMKTDKVEYFEKCEALMKKVETKCGNLNDKGRLESPCVAGFSKELESLIPKQLN